MSKPEKTIAPGTVRAIDSVFAATAKRVMERCEVLGGISDEAGRITRTFLSPATKRAQELVMAWMREAGLSVRVDAAGNVIGRREGAGDVKTFVIGSHLDTVPNAGKYDGILGVLAGIELAELMRDIALPFAVEVVGFSEEEGVRFGRPYIGSHAYAGTLDAGWLELKDKNGVSVEEAIRGFGLDPAPLRSLRKRTDLRGYFEIHIEQGPEMERSDVPVAAVGAIAGQTRMQVRFHGAAGHAGTTPMDLRHDALAAAAEGILAVEMLAKTSLGSQNEPLVATVGQIAVTPNASNVIPGEVHFSIDVRHTQDEVRERAAGELATRLEGIAEQRGIQMEMVARQDFPAVPMDEILVAGLLEAVQANSGRRFILSSGAGHDAAILAAIAPAAMLFVRSPGGISHSPLENVNETDIAVALAAACEFVGRIGT
ncbi:MAG TPA: allantoate amidohydrolase [Phycisphaerae bacterium]|nr:allantoate amidohydrolase [Phycisphaerae bacterium]